MYVMTLKEKVFFYRNKYRKEKIFEINNSDLNKKYYGIFEDNQEELHYDSSNSYDELIRLKNERKSSEISKKYKIFSADDFKKLWFDVEFWNYILLYAKNNLEIYHYKYKLKLLKEKIFF